MLIVQPNKTYIINSFGVIKEDDGNKKTQGSRPITVSGSNLIASGIETSEQRVAIRDFYQFLTNN